MAIPFTRPGAPGVQAPGMSAGVEAMLLTQGVPTITDKDVRDASEVLRRYKDGKANLEERIVQDELWWQQRHWEAIGRRRGSPYVGPKPTSAWLFNAILNKHADAMDNYPEPVVLPREQSDKQSAEVLSEVLPVVLEYNEFDRTYSSNWWEKLKHGAAAYGVFWDAQKENGLGDIDIRRIDLLNLFWEPGITDLQKSRNLFITDLVDNEVLEQTYPELSDKILSTPTVDLKQYLYDDNVDTSEKSVVVDWYYKVKGPDGRTILHYAKFVGDTLLYASENEPEYRERGFYDHGMYPVVLDVLWPEKGTPVGFGYVAICKDPQMYIDKLYANILETSMQGTKRRYFLSDGVDANEAELLDWNKPFVHVTGPVTDERLKEISTRPLDNVYLNVLQLKVEEMKDTAANRDVNSGGKTGGVTAASAIAALQEAGNKASRDMIASSYRAHSEIVRLCIELIRQFYDERRSFRIMAPEATDYTFVEMDNSGLRDQVVGMTPEGVALYRRPTFDLKIKAQRRNPFSRMEQNETAKELYGMGFFNPQQAQASLIALNMMDFEGIEDVRAQVQQGQTLYNIVQQQQQQIAALSQIITGAAPPVGGQPQQQPQRKPSTPATDGVMAAQAPRSGYTQRLVQRSKPSVEGG